MCPERESLRGILRMQPFGAKDLRVGGQSLRNLSGTLLNLCQKRCLRNSHLLQTSDSACREHHVDLAVLTGALAAALQGRPGKKVQCF